MKLLYCANCDDVFSLRLNKERSCECGKTKGKYIDNLNAVYSGPAITMGFNNPSLEDALDNQPLKGSGKEFTAFVIPQICATFKPE